MNEQQSIDRSGTLTPNFSRFARYCFREAVERMRKIDMEKSYKEYIKKKGIEDFGTSREKELILNYAQYLIDQIEDIMFYMDVDEQFKNFNNYR